MKKDVFIHGGNIHFWEKHLNCKILDFSSNINPFVYPYIKTFFESNLSLIIKSIIHYPDPAAEDLTQSLSKYLNISSSCILWGNGATELIYLIPKGLKIKHALVIAPTFLEYEKALLLNNSKVSFYFLTEQKNFIPDLKEVIDLIKIKKVDSIFICNPDNPTGNLLFDLEEIKQLLSLKIFIIIDESFMDFVPGSQKISAIQLSQDNPYLIVIKSLTKYLGIPGLRLGYLISHQQIIKFLRNFIPPWNINALAQILANYLLQCKTFLNESKTLIQQEKNKILKTLKNFKNLKVFPSLTNFLLIKILHPKLNSKIITQKLLETGILIRDCQNFKGLNHKYFRIAIKSPEENALFLEAFKNLWKGVINE